MLGLLVVTNTYLQELSHCFEHVLDVLSAEQPEKDAVVDAILTYAFYWYNFMPLARGTAVVGYIVILALFLAAGMPITATIPKVRPFFPSMCRPLVVGGVGGNQAEQQRRYECTTQGCQVDWEAILSQHPGQFKAAVVPWLVPSSQPGQERLDNLPSVSRLLPTFRARLEALNGLGTPRI